MNDRHSNRERSRERGSALVIALLVTFVLSLLGVSFLLMAQTESRIAHNEWLTVQGFYMAEAGARVVKSWFDGPGTALSFPPPDVVDLSLRQTIDETDPYTGTPNLNPDPYKELPDGTPIDYDGDGLRDLFERPYRGEGDEHKLLGTPDGPDMRIDDQSANPAVRVFLDELTATLFGATPVPNGYRARISRIDVYAPPYVEIGGTWARFGIATIRVAARVYKLNPDLDEIRVLSEQSVELVLNEIPYRTPVFGPLHTCGDLEFTGPLTARWGAVTAIGDVRGYDDALPSLPDNIPRSQPPGARLDRLWVDQAADADCVREYVTRTSQTSESVADPWQRLFAQGLIETTPNGSHPYASTVAFPTTGCVPTSTATLQPCCDRSNLFQDDVSTPEVDGPLITCPEYDYAFWKNIATSGEPGVFYYVPDPVTPTFRERGTGPPETFTEITNARQGLFFFDTVDGREPLDVTGDGVPDNLSPAVTVDGVWGTAGFVYLNAVSLTIDTPIAPATLEVGIRPPGELFLDADSDGRHVNVVNFENGLPEESWVSTSEPWINFTYPGTIAGSYILNAADTTLDDGTSGANPVRNAAGPTAFDTRVSLYGILYTNGSLALDGPGDFYGSLIAAGDVTLGASGTAPDIIFDGRIGVAWPPVDLPLPRVTVTRWGGLR